MIYWAIVFFVVAVLAGVLAFGGMVSAATSIAQILFFVFSVLFAAALVSRALRDDTP